MLYIGSLTLNQIPFNFAKRVQIYKDNYIWVGLNDQKQYKPIDFSRCWKKKNVRYSCCSVDLEMSPFATKMRGMSPITEVTLG